MKWFKYFQCFYGRKNAAYKANKKARYRLKIELRRELNK